jgi:hypothetical protein
MNMLDTRSYVVESVDQPSPLSVVTGSFCVEQTSGNGSWAAQSALDHSPLSVVSSMGTTTIVSDIISEATDCVKSVEMRSVATCTMICYSFPDISSNLDEGSHVLGDHQSDFLGLHSLY